MSITFPLTLPTVPVFRATRWRPRTVVGVSTSPFTLAMQTYSHPGRRWEVGVELPPMVRARAAAWQAFFGKLDGAKGTFLMGDPAARALRGAGGGTPVINGAHAARVSNINVRGLAEIANVWREGDWIQLGSGATARLHMVLADISGAGSPTGEANVDIWPTTRAAYSDGAAIVVANTVGVFKLASDVDWDIDEAVRYGFGFDAVEAL